MSHAISKPPIIAKPARTAPVWWSALAAMALVLVGVLYKFNPSSHTFYPRCQFFELTHLHCPGCGGLRAIHHLSHGEFVAAFHCNPLVVISLLLAAAWLVLSWWRGRTSEQVTSARFGMLACMGLGIAILFGIVRNLPGPAFSWMSP